MAKDLILKKVGSRIRACRLKAGLTQEDVEGYGVSWKHYQKIESGQTNTTIKVLFKLARAFRCNAKEFFP